MMNSMLVVHTASYFDVRLSTKNPTPIALKFRDGGGGNVTALLLHTHHLDGRRRYDTHVDLRS